MKCLNCGTENVERARFCVKCGMTLVEQNEPVIITEPTVTDESPEMKMPIEKPKKKKGFKVLLIVLIAAICASLLAVGGVWFVSANNPYNKHVKIGYEYLDEGKYEEAILEFDKAIEINARKPKAYVGKADTYATRCDENVVTDIKDTFTEAKEQNERNIETIINETLRIADFIKDNGYEQISIDLLEAMYDLLQDERLRQKADEHFEQYYKMRLMELYNGGEEDIKEFLVGDEIGYIISRMSEVDCFWYSENDDLSAPGSHGIGLYPDEFIYIGEWSDGMFEGSGKYYGVDSEKTLYVIFDGEFSAGVPNGYGNVIMEYMEGMRNENTGYTYIRFEDAGNFTDGIYNGEFEKKAITDGGEIQIAEPKVLYDNGIAQKLDDFSATQYIISKVPGTSLVWLSEGDVEYAPGYPREESIRESFEENAAEETTEEAAEETTKDFEA